MMLCLYMPLLHKADIPSYSSDSFSPPPHKEKNNFYFYFYFYFYYHNQIIKGSFVNKKKIMNLSSSSSSSSSLSITPPPFLPSTTKHTCFSSSSSATTRCSFVNSPVSIGVSSPRRLPISLVRKQSKTFFGVVSASSGSRDMTSVTQASGDGDEAPLLDPESYSKPRRIALFVEPSPFA